MAGAPPAPLYSLHELAWRTQYAELRERSRAAGTLLPGTPGTLYERNGTGYAYLYRVYYPAPGRQAEDLIGPASDEAAVQAARDAIAASQWMTTQVSHLRKLGFQVADKAVGRVLVELHNEAAFEAGLVLVGTLGYMARLNELGARAVALRTQDIDLARRQVLRLASPLSFLQTVQATHLPFVAVPGLPSQQPSTSVKLPGKDGLRIDVLAPARTLGTPVRVPELDWHAQGVPLYDYLLEGAEDGALLAGGHCVPLRLPRADRMLWHKLYSSTARTGAAEKAAKDVHQAATLLAILVEQDDLSLPDSLAEAPSAVRSAARKRLPALRRALAAHPQALEAAKLALAG